MANIQILFGESLDKQTRFSLTLFNVFTTFLSDLD